MSKSSSNNPSLNNLLKLYLESRNSLNSNQTAELEVKFGTRGIKSITKIDFDNVIKQLMSNNFKFNDESIYYLSIKTDSIRTEIIGLKNIQSYCMTNSLPSERPIEAYNFVEKKPYTIGEERVYPVNFDEFNFRVAYFVETSLLPDSQVIENLSKTWDDNKKFYRLIKRYTMTHDVYPVKIDLSIVRESGKDDSDNIKESNIFHKNEKYEIEIEVDNEKINKIEDSQMNSNLLDKILKKITKFILSGLQETNYPISYIDQNYIIKDYLQLVKKTREDDSINVTPKDFIGPSSSTLQIINIVPLTQDIKAINIRNNYTVTDKADGIRKMLYVSSIGKIYLITMNMNIQFTGAETGNKELFNSLLDGEHIKHNKTGKFINLYASFDIYFIGGKDVRELEFFPQQTEDIPTKFRLPILQKFIENLNPVLVNTETISPIRIEKKRFFETNEYQNIFDGCYTIQNNMNQGLYEYETDGLIFTPMNLGVGVNKKGDQPKSYKSSWDYSLKWKPAEFNTVDFLITTKKIPNGGDFIGNLFQSGIDTSSLNQIIQYKTLILRVGFNERQHGYINPCENIINDNINLTDDFDDNKGYKPIQFFPTNPYDPEAGICNILLKLDNTSEKQMFTEENEVIEDNMIVEFRYDPTREKQWRWIPLRIRYDKTAEYRAGYKNYGNAYHVAQSNWNSIHNPITLNMITTGNDIPNELGDTDIYYNKFQGVTHTRSLRDFHNLYVKNALIKSVSNIGDTLIDYAVGKGGDLPKWIAAKLSFVFGIDLSRDNIENRLDGICARYLNYKKKYKLMPDIVPDGLFIQGNANQNIKNLSAQYTEKGKQITKAIFGEGPKDEKILGKGVLKSHGRAINGFNISSIQFAIHYMFENPTLLHNFLTNVAECTQIGGYFIGTSYNGKKIFELLKDKKQGESVVIMDRDNSNKLLEITKVYDRDEFLDNISCLGYGIDVFQESINKTFREYLVNYDYLIQLLENYGFIQLTSDELSRINFPKSVGDFSDLFDLMNNEIKREPIKRNDYGTAYKMTAEQRKISFLNKYFIFKKVRNIDPNDINIALVQETANNEKQRVVESLIAQQQVKSVISTKSAKTPKDETPKDETPKDERPKSKTQKKSKLKLVT